MFNDNDIFNDNDYTDAIADPKYRKDLINSLTWKRIVAFLFIPFLCYYAISRDDNHSFSVIATLILIQAFEIDSRLKMVKMFDEAEKARRQESSSPQKDKH